MVSSLLLVVLLSATPDAANAGSNDGFYAQGELTPWLGVEFVGPGAAGGVGMIQGVAAWSARWRLSAVLGAGVRTRFDGRASVIAETNLVL